MKKQKQPKIRIGIVGEHPNNDALALKYLLESVAMVNTEFVVMQKNHRGGQLDSMKFFRTLRAEFKAEKPRYVILIRDLDGLLSESDKVIERDKWFNKANKEIQYSGIFYLAIYEMEALILSDIENFNRYFGLSTKASTDPMLIENPKKIVQNLTKSTSKGKYMENTAPKIFQSLSFKNICKHHKGERSFQKFAEELVIKHIISIS